MRDIVDNFKELYAYVNMIKSFKFSLMYLLLRNCVISKNNIDRHK